MQFDLQLTSKWNAVCWVELRCVDKAFSTDMLSGWLTDKCVCVCGWVSVHVRGRQTRGH